MKVFFSEINIDFISFAGELSGLIEISGAVCLVVIPANVSIAQEIKKSNPKIRSIVVVGEAPLGCHSFYEMSKADTQGVEFFKGSSIDTTKEIAILPFSSGTTGVRAFNVVIHLKL